MYFLLNCLGLTLAKISASVSSKSLSKPWCVVDVCLNLYDDGLGNLLSASLKVGDVIYEHGVIIITNAGIPGFPDGYGFVNYGTAVYDSTLSNLFYNALISFDGGGTYVAITTGTTINMDAGTLNNIYLGNTFYYDTNTNTGAALYITYNS